MPATIPLAPRSHNTRMQPRIDNLMPSRHTRRHAVHALVAIGAGAVLPGAGAQQLAPWAGPVPPLPQPLLDLEGKAWMLPVPGRATVVNFWASWCEPCRSEMPALQQMADLYGDRLSVVALNFKERPATAQRFARTTGLAMPVLLDPWGAAAAAWGVKVFPTTLLFDAKGRPRLRVQGAIDWTDAKVGALVETLLR
jgi:thiol-disulfide isomerase/thioredoxin